MRGFTIAEVVGTMLEVMCPRYQTPALSAHRVTRKERLSDPWNPKVSADFPARSSSISVWRGTDECVFSLGLCHHECLRPSRSNAHPFLRKCRISYSRFIPEGFPRISPLLLCALPAG